MLVKISALEPDAPEGGLAPPVGRAAEVRLRV